MAVNNEGDEPMNLEIISEEPKATSHQTPLLFVHGAWHGAWCWQENFLPYFAEHGYASHALSLRGHGASEKAAHPRLMRIADYVNDVEEVVNGLPQTPVLIGHSMGGLVVQKYLESHSAPAAVLLASVPAKGVLRTTLSIARRHPLLFLKANLTWSLYPLIGKPELARESFFSAGISPDLLDIYSNRLQDESYLAFLDMMLFNLPKPKNVKTDLLVLGAENDTIFVPDEIKATAEAYKTEAEIFPDMAHDIMLENGWQKAADRILDWLVEKKL